MIAVWSHWSKPHQAHHSHAWYSERHHLLAWVLSVQTAKQHFEAVHLYTDDAGARLLVDQLGLPFAHVSTQLNELETCDPAWWALGKIQAYRLQTQPFIHIDADVFLWKPLPERLAYADVFSQHCEPFGPQYPYYQPEQLERLLANKQGGWLPDEWRWFRQGKLPQHAECCGVLGGSQVGFIRHYADVAFRFITDAANQTVWCGLADKLRHMVLMEQYLLSACVQYHARQPNSLHRGIAIERLFVEPEAAHDPVQQTALGYTHLIGGLKRSKAVAQHLAELVRQDYPEYYERCLAAAQN